MLIQRHVASNNDLAPLVSNTFRHLSSLNFTEVNLYPPIFLNWHLNSDRFHYLNYKCLESILVNYPNSTITIFIIAPAMASYYKIGSILSRQTFQKYTKSGFPVKVEIISKGTTSIPSPSTPGYSYWMDALNKNDQEKHITTLGKANHIGFFTTLYYIVARLYEEGGIYSDFSWFHVNSMISVYRLPLVGFVFKDVCGEKQGCTVSVLLAFPAKHPIPLCILKQFENSSFIECGESTENAMLSCVIESFDRCFLQSSAINSFVLIQQLTSDLYFNHSTHDVHGQPCWWMGTHAFAGDWGLPNPSSPLTLQIKSNDAYIQSSPRLNFKILEDINHFIFPSCHPYYTFAEDNKSFRNQASLSCSLQFVMPGFMKAGSSFVFDTIVSNHPFLLRTLKGVQFKESGCYSPEKITPNNRIHRAHCFPFVESGDKKYFGDATVSYAGRYEVAEFLQKDNPTLKVLFVVRNPVSRSISHHRFDYAAYRSKGIGNINHCVDMLFISDNRLREWNNLAWLALNSTSTEGCYSLRQLYALYRTGLRHNSTAAYAKCGNLLLNSIYVLHMLRWYQVFGHESIRVVNVEWLHAKNLGEEEKKKRLQQSPVIDDPSTLAFNSSSKQQLTDKRSSNHDVVKSKSTRLSNLDHQYLLFQFNHIYRYSFNSFILLLSSPSLRIDSLAYLSLQKRGSPLEAATSQRQLFLK